MAYCRRAIATPQEEGGKCWNCVSLLFFFSFFSSRPFPKWPCLVAFPRRSRCCKHFPFHKLSFSVSSPFCSVYTTTTWPHVACLMCALGVFRSLFSSAIHTQNGPQQGGGVSAPVQRLRLLQRWRSRWHGAGPMLHCPGCSHHTQPIVPPGREQHAHTRDVGLILWSQHCRTVQYTVRLCLSLCCRFIIFSFSWPCHPVSSHFERIKTTKKHNRSLKFLVFFHRFQSGFTK